MTEITETDKERYLNTSNLIYADRGDRKAEFNQKAAAQIKMMRETLPDLDDKTVFVIFSSVAYLMSTIMMAPLAKAGPDVEELFDTFTLAAASLIGVVDLDDAAPAPTPAELEKKELMAEIERLRGELAKPDGGEDYRPGTYL